MPARVALGVVGVVFVGLFYRWFRQQYVCSITALEDWGHAFAVPFLSAYLVYREREGVLRTPVATFWPGLLPLVLGVMCYLFFVVGVPNHLGQGLALMLALSGVILLTLGVRQFRFYVLPLLFFIFAITLPQQVMEMITFRLKLIASDGAALVLGVVSLGGSLFEVEAAGNIITVAGHPLNVADQCSGMRMVIAFAALAAAVAVLSCKLWWQRSALILIAVPVAVVMNVFRVAILGLATLIDPNLASGDAHKVIGTLLLIPTLFLFLGLRGLMDKMITTDDDVTPVKNAKSAGAPGSNGGSET